MFMRYYPKEIKSIPRLEMTPKDRGKRHYWGYQKSDYGFVESEDLPKQQKIYKHHHRGYSSDLTNNFVYDKIADQNNNLQKNSARNILLKPSKKRALNIYHPIEIHLPTIRRNTQETQTTEEQNPQQRNYENGKEKDWASKNIQRIKDIGNKKYFQKYQRHRTQADEQSNRKNASINNRLNPTFVCSIQNPLPSYIIQPHVYNSYNYTRNGVTTNLKQRYQ